MSKWVEEDSLQKCQEISVCVHRVGFCLGFWTFSHYLPMAKSYCIHNFNIDVITLKERLKIWYLVYKFSKEEKHHNQSRENMGKNIVILSAKRNPAMHPRKQNKETILFKIIGNGHPRINMQSRVKRMMGNKINHEKETCLWIWM